MRTLGRPFCTVLLLASYTLASAGVWLHTSGFCLVGPRESTACAAHACCGMKLGHRGPQQAVERMATEKGWCAEPPGPSPDHERDTCLLCRFSVISKGMALSQEAPAPSRAVCRPVTMMLPSLVTADRQHTWCCRAPPLVSSPVS